MVVPAVWSRGIAPAAAGVLAVTAACSTGDGAGTAAPSPEVTPVLTTPTATSFSGHGTGQPRPPQPTRAPSTGGAGTPPDDAPLRIEAVELHPEDPMPGGQFVVIANRGRAEVTVDCWTLQVQDGSTVRVRTDGPVAPGGALRLIAETSLLDATDAVSLLDASGRVVDSTPELTDTTGDDQLWYRSGSGTWAFGNGYRLTSDAEDGRLVVDTC